MLPQGMIPSTEGSDDSEEELEVGPQGEGEPAASSGRESNVEPSLLFLTKKVCSSYIIACVSCGRSALTSAACR